MKNVYLVNLDECLEQILNKIPDNGNLQESARYMLFNQGKRLRPMIIVALLDDLKLLQREHYFTALSLEILHTASLIHDDLPALDNDDYRRGKLSCHKKYSEPLAILLGDYLQTLAIQVVVENARGEDLRALSKVLTNGYLHVCLGQILDITQTSEPDLSFINRLKTASLFSCGFQMAGIQAKCTEFQIEELRKLGEEFGLIFQLINDYQDCFLSPESTGRRDSSDSKNNKQTLINKFSNSQDAKKYLEEKILIWNKNFDLLKVEFKQPFLNLAQIVNSIFQAES